MKFKLEEKYKTEEEQLKAVEEDFSAIRYIKDPSEKIKLTAVQHNLGWAIKFIKNPSEEIQLEAIKQNSLNIQYIENPSEKIKLAAVRKFGHAICYIKNPSEKIKLEAVKNCGSSILYIRNPSEEIQLEAVKTNPQVISCDNVIITEKVIIAALNSPNLKDEEDKKDFKYLLAALNIDWDRISNETKSLIAVL